jgi:hypothetical protein
MSWFDIRELHALVGNNTMNCDIREFHVLV